MSPGHRSLPLRKASPLQDIRFGKEASFSKPMAIGIIFLSSKLPKYNVKHILSKIFYLLSQSSMPCYMEYNYIHVPIYCIEIVAKLNLKKEYITW